MAPSALLTPPTPYISITMALDATILKELATAATEADVRHALEGIAERFGAAWYTASRFTSAAHGAAAIVLSNHPRTIESDLDAVEPAAADPVMQHLRTRSDPILWGRDTYGRSPRVWSVMADYGIVGGASVAVHAAADRHQCLALSFAHSAQAQVDALVDLQCYALYAEQVFARVFTAGDFLTLLGAVRLTDREAHCVYLAGCGKSDRVIADVLGIGARTVRAHIEAVMNKLGASSRTEAAVIATRLGLTDRFHLQYRR